MMGKDLKQEGVELGVGPNYKDLVLGLRNLNFPKVRDFLSQIQDFDLNTPIIKLSKTGLGKVDSAKTLPENLAIFDILTNPLFLFRSSGKLESYNQIWELLEEKARAMGYIIPQEVLSAKEVVVEVLTPANSMPQKQENTNPMPISKKELLPEEQLFKYLKLGEYDEAKKILEADPDLLKVRYDVGQAKLYRSASYTLELARRQEVRNQMKQIIEKEKSNSSTNKSAMEEGGKTEALGGSLDEILDTSQSLISLLFSLNSGDYVNKYRMLKYLVERGVELIPEQINFDDLDDEALQVPENKWLLEYRTKVNREKVAAIILAEKEANDLYVILKKPITPSFKNHDSSDQDRQILEMRQEINDLKQEVEAQLAMLSKPDVEKLEKDINEFVEKQKVEAAPQVQAFRDKELKEGKINEGFNRNIKILSDAMKEKYDSSQGFFKSNFTKPYYIGRNISMLVLAGGLGILAFFLFAGAPYLVPVIATFALVGLLGGFAAFEIKKFIDLNYVVPQKAVQEAERFLENSINEEIQEQFYSPIDLAAETMREKAMQEINNKFAYNIKGKQSDIKDKIQEFIKKFDANRPKTNTSILYIPNASKINAALELGPKKDASMDDPQNVQFTNAIRELYDGLYYRSDLVKFMLSDIAGTEYPYLAAAINKICRNQTPDIYGVMENLGQNQIKKQRVGKEIMGFITDIDILEYNLQVEKDDKISENKALEYIRKRDKFVMLENAQNLKEFCPKLAELFEKEKEGELSVGDLPSVEVKKPQAVNLETGTKVSQENNFPKEEGKLV